MRFHHLLMLAPVLVVVLGAKPAKVPLALTTEQVPLAVAVRDIAAGELVAQEDVAQVLVPKEWVTSG